MLTLSALQLLSAKLETVVESFGVSSSTFGRPDIIQKAAAEAARTFQAYAKAQPSKADSYAAALALMRGQALDERQYHLIASALCEQVREQDNARVIGHKRLAPLLTKYRADADAGELWRLTWFGLLSSYFSFDPSNATEQESAGWRKLSRFLQETWTAISHQSTSAVVPDWIRVLRNDPHLISDKAADRYSRDFLNGEDEAVRRLAQDLAIPEASWFWHALVLAAVKACTQLSDDRAFKDSIPRLLELIVERPVFRDEAIEEILKRYQKCADKSVHVELRDYVVHKDVWRNPKLREAGKATAWTRVSNDVWNMVLQWVNRANLRDFFEVLAAEGGADEGRLAFWSQYMEQITWTRLIFSKRTQWLARSNKGIRNLIAREEDSYAVMSTNGEVDAFMMQLGDYVIVEFSRMPNAAYVYEADALPFEPYSTSYSGTVEDLKHGFGGARAARFTHLPGWQATARAELQRLGISPDQRASSLYGSAYSASNTTSTYQIVSGAPHRAQAAHSKAPSSPKVSAAPAKAPPNGASFSMRDLQELVMQYFGAKIDDRRNTLGGRLWVEDPKQRRSLESELKRLGFKWAVKRSAWFFPED